LARSPSPRPYFDSWRGVPLDRRGLDEDQHLHPDERFLTMVETSLGVPGLGDIGGPLPQGCSKWGGYFNTQCSPLNPYNHNLAFSSTEPSDFSYPRARRIIGQVGYGENLYRGSGPLRSLRPLDGLAHLLHRARSRVRAGLLGATLPWPPSVLDIQQSHFFTVDTFTNVPILIAFWYAMEIADGKNWTNYLVCGCSLWTRAGGAHQHCAFCGGADRGGALRAWLDAKKSWQAPVEPVSETAADSSDADSSGARNAERTATRSTDVARTL